MGRATKVPITPKVLRWAIAESGFGLSDVAAAVGASTDELQIWLSGEDQPSLTQMRGVANKLGRALATFLLPEVPSVPMPAVELRSPPGSSRRTLNPVERKHLRHAVRVQRTVSWVLEQSAGPPISLPHRTVDDDPAAVGDDVTRLLRLPDDVRLTWGSQAEALAGWRVYLERIGMLVFLLPLGRESCRGFSVWDDRAPVIVANTEYNAAARTFTILHELGHLVTRTSSACLEMPAGVRQADRTERWCEEFAAAVLLPMPDVLRVLEESVGWRPGEEVRDVRTVGVVARKLHASLRATALRLIKAGLAGQQLYERIPVSSEHRRAGGGGAGRTRPQARRDQLGARPIRVMLDAANSGILNTTDVLEYLDVHYSDRGTLESAIATTEHG
jgi:Zn-dependent peptidase ImmA (M78 family)